MSTTNEIWLPINGHLERLDLDDETQLLPTFQANDRTKPESIQSDYSPEFSVPGTAANHRRLKHAAASQPAQGSGYLRVPCVLTSGGVETLPLGLLYLKGFKEGRYQLQLFGGNRRLVEALGDKTLADLDLNRFNHSWTPANIAAGLPYSTWLANGWGYEVIERGKPLDLQAINPYTLYPSVAFSLVWQQILADAGFTADSLMGEALFAALNMPSANPYTFPAKFREARALQAGLLIPAGQPTNALEHTAEFAAEQLRFNYTALAPYHAPTAGAAYSSAAYTADTLGYYDIEASLLLNYGCDDRRAGKVSCKVMLYVNGQPVFYQGVQVGQDEHPRVGSYVEETFAPSLKHYLLHPGDVVTLWWQGDDWPGTLGGPYDQRWRVAYLAGRVADVGIPGQLLYTQGMLTITLLEEFPEGGTVRLQEWLPDLKQLDVVKAGMLLLGLTIQSDQYRPHLRLAPGNRLLANIPAARDWTAKRDAYAQPGRLPERDLAFRFGEYGQANYLKWTEDENVTAGYGDGQISVADEVLPTEYTMAVLPFAASERSPLVAGLLRILNFKVDNIAANPLTYSAVEAKPRLTLRGPDPQVAVQLSSGGNLTPVTTTASYFAGVPLSLLLNGPVLTGYWADLRAMLDQARYLVEYYRLTPQDIAELDFSVPIWDGGLGDYFAASAVGEYAARRPVEVRLCRLNAAHLPAPRVPGEPLEFYSQEFYPVETY